MTLSASAWFAAGRYTGPLPRMRLRKGPSTLSARLPALARVATLDGRGGNYIVMVAWQFGEHVMVATWFRVVQRTPSVIRRLWPWCGKSPPSLWLLPIWKKFARRRRRMAVLLLLVGLVPVDVVAVEECAADFTQKLAESKAVMELEDWDSLYQSYAEYGDCRSDYLDSSYSYLVGRLLAKRWQQLSRFQELGSSDPAFMGWVFEEQLNTRIPKGRLVAIHENARNRCPADLQELCGHLLETTGDPTSELLVVAKGKVEAKATVRNMVKVNCSYTDMLLGSGDGVWKYARSACPTAIMDRLEVSYDGNSVHVPAMSYNDIADAYVLSVQLGEGDAYVVSVSANDGDSDAAGCSYKASLEFVGEAITGRTVVRRCGSYDELSATAVYVLIPELGEYGIAAPGDKAYRELSVSKHDITATATIRDSFPGDCVPRFSYPHGGHGGDLCPNLVEKLVVTYHGKEVSLPISAYSYSYDVEGLSIKLIADYSMYVILIHLDQATQFLFFEGGSLSRGIGWSDLFLDHIKEETEYSLH